MLLNKKSVLTEKFAEIMDLKNLFPDEPLSRHTSFRIGGPAAFYAICENETELKDAIRICKEENVKFFLLGNGTNVLAADEGYDGVILRLGGDFNLISIREDINDGSAFITSGAGVALTQLSMYALKKGFTGLEFAHGIPGSVGGGIFMNAGAYGGELNDTLVSVKVMAPDGEIKEVTKEEAEMGYRTSRFEKTGEFILSGTFHLKVYPRIPIRTMMEEYKRRRIEKQPLDLPSAGSAFKRPEGNFAGKLIEEAGLKGFKVGGAAVSEKHAGFIVNTDNATAADVEAVIENVREKVYKNSGVMLEPEIRILK
ncbi:MAG: UDP-N-acetylmuramate dehydrogenase [Lachnospiraceae bacterium]|nr:UDP-N-acetylmuramate dehydrogenase [Lachnospiraceae bacterium]